MNNLCFFYSAKIAVVFILMLLSSATLEAQRNENDKFFDLMAAIGEHFGGEFNDAEKALELDLNRANSFLKELHKFATHEIVRKNENGQFECKKSKKSDFKMAIKEIVGEKPDKNVRNLLKALVPKPSVKMPSETVNSVKFSGDQFYTIKAGFGEKSFKRLEDLVKELSVKFSEEKLFNLLFSLGARLEALVHGKNIDGTLKEKQKNSKDKIQTFLAVPKCFQELELRIFDYWIEIIEMKTKKSQKPIFGVAIYKQYKYDKSKSEDNKEQRFIKLSQENYKILKQLNDQKFSIYESTKLLREIFNQGYREIRISQKKILQIFVDLFAQINSVLIYDWGKTNKCAYAMFFQNISESLMKMMSDKGIDPKFHLDSQDKEIQEYVQKDVKESCKNFENEEAKIIFLNKVHYELAINFEFNQRKDVYDRADDLMFDWLDDWTLPYHEILQLTEKLYLKKDVWRMLLKIKHFTSKKTNREAISIIEALIGKEFNLGSLFDQIKWLVEVTIPEEAANLEKAKKEINKKQLEKDIKILKKNPKSIAEEKYQKVVAIICTIKEYGEKVKMLKSKIKTIEIQKKMIELLSKIQNTEKKYFGIELWEQMKESCNQLKPKQIQMEKIVSEEILLADLRFEFDEIWHSYKGVWEGIEEYYLEIPLMQLKEQARTLAQTFGKMLQNVKELYAPKMDESNDGGE